MQQKYVSNFDTFLEKNMDLDETEEWLSLPSWPQLKAFSSFLYRHLICIVRLQHETLSVEAAQQDQWSETQILLTTLCVRAGKTLAIHNGIWLEAIALTRQYKINGA